MPTRTHALLLATAIALTLVPDLMARFFAAMERRTDARLPQPARIPLPVR